MTKWDIGTKPNVFEGTGTTPPSGALETACPEWLGYTRYPCVAVTDPGSDFSYRFKMQNVGNVPMTNYVMYDISRSSATPVSPTMRPPVSAAPNGRRL
ncbi:MAG: hypothetical protein IPL93_01070 [Actinomycetales bacterium]|nr:hypothetical protein [Actinomycetales bacterium]